MAKYSPQIICDVLDEIDSYDPDPYEPILHHLWVMFGMDVVDVLDDLITRHLIELNISNEGLNYAKDHRSDG